MVQTASESSANAPVSPLPLIDRGWVLFNSAHAELAKNNSGVRAARQITERLRNGGLRSMIQRDYPERDSKPERVQLSELYWDGYEAEYARNMLHVFPRERMFRSIYNPGLDLQQQGYTFFVWGPDLKKCFGAEIADALKPPSKAKTRAKPDGQRGGATRSQRKTGRQRTAKPRKRLQRQIAEAIVEVHYPYAVRHDGSLKLPEEVLTTTVMHKIADDWTAKCTEFSVRKKRPTAPEWHAVNRLLGREP
jgi:hypothetical protein